MGPFPVERRKLKFLVVGIDYFTKWVEAEPLATITEKNVKGFVWKAIICRFGIPRAFISDNGQVEELGIRNHYSSPGHPQANGQVEVTNRSLLNMIKTRLEGQRDCGLKSSQISCGHTGRQQELPPEKLHFD